MPVPVSGPVLNLVTSDLTHAGNHILTHTGHPVVLNHGEHELQSHWKKKSLAFIESLMFIIAIIEGKQACVTENSKGAWTTPSVVAFTKHGEHLVGLPAKCQAMGLIGCKFKGVDVQEDLKHWLSAEELSSMVLTKMHETAEQFLDKKVNHPLHKQLIKQMYYNQKETKKKAPERLVSDKSFDYISEGTKNGLIASYVQPLTSNLLMGHVDSPEATRGSTQAEPNAFTPLLPLCFVKVPLHFDSSPLGVSEFVRGGSDNGWDNHWQEQQDEDEGEPQL
ncbi:hypothetical protein BKA82DRAFT_4013985 [Pisolithus tinctorius]|nr:hypothetical protein BKA82DRAFT_4013985 [Pisolithus tinctorius]